MTKTTALPLAAAVMAATATLLGPAAAQSKIDAKIVVRGLENPWGLAFLPDGSALVTEREGRLQIVADGKISGPVEGVPEVAAVGQGGLLDVAVDPAFAQNRLIYLSFSEPGDGGAGTAVARGRLVQDGATTRLDDVAVIFRMEKKTSAGQHFGSRLVFAPDGNLFVTTGDRGDGKRAQDFMDHAGAVIRIATDGSIPQDNPFRSAQNAKPELWSKGHRNVQGAAWDPVTGALVTVEHGARGGDEINRPEAGKNYGWPEISYGKNYSGTKIGVGTEAEGFEQPLHYWDPSIAPSGMVSYQGDMFPDWKGDLLVGALKFEMLVRLDRDASGTITGEERMLRGRFGRIRDVREAPDGSVWLLTDEANGSIVRVSAEE